MRRRRRGSVSADDDDEERQIARNLWRHMRLLPPTGVWRKRWNKWLLLLVLWNIIFLPLNLCFVRGPDPLSPRELDYVMDVFFLVDIILNFRTTLRVEDTDELITDWRVLGARYLRTWFPVDLCATMPWEVFLLGQDVSPQLIRALKMPRILRLIRLRKEVNLETGKSMVLARVLGILFVFVVLAHWVGSFWWLIGSVETIYGQLRLDEAAGCAPSASGCGGLYSSSWLQQIPQIRWNGEKAYALTLDSPLAQQYFSSLYWSLTALVKVPWVAPTTVVEKLYGGLTVMLGAIFFAALLGNITAAVQAFERSNKERTHTMMTMHHFAETRKLPAELKQEMVRFVDAKFACVQPYEGTERLGALPVPLRSGLLRAIWKDLLAESPLLRAPTEQTALLLTQFLQPCVCMPKATLIERNAVSNELYILQRGMLHVHAAAAEDGKASRKKFGAKAALRFRAVEKMGAFVGFYDPYDFRIRLPLEVVAQKLSQLFAINRLDLLDVLDAVGEGEANAVLKVLDDEKNLVLKALKVDRRSISVADPSSVPDLAAVAAEAEAAAEGAPAPATSGSPPARRKSDARRPSAVGLTGGGGRRPSQALFLGGLGEMAGLGAPDGAAGESAPAPSHRTLGTVDELVASVKGSFAAVQDATESYQAEVDGTAACTASLQDLLAELRRLPPDERPTASDAEQALVDPSYLPPSRATFHKGRPSQQRAPVQAKGGPPMTTPRQLFDNIIGFLSTRGSQGSPEGAAAAPAPAAEPDLTA